MATFGLDASGGINDPVRIVVNGIEVAIVESYEFVNSVLDVPTSFALRVGHNGVVKDLIQQFPPHSQYTIYIGNILQASGRLDGFSVPSDDGTTLELRGRDALAPLHDAYIDVEKSYSGISYLDLVDIALAAAGIKDPGPFGGKAIVIFNNHDYRQKVTGVPVRAIEPKGVQDIVVEKGTGGVVYKTVIAKLGERWIDLVRTHIDRAGLFLWATNDGGFVLTAPNPNQEPTYELTLDPQASMDQRGFRGGVRRDEYHNGAEPPRYSKVVVYSRTAAKKFGRGKIKGSAIDQEMIDLGINRPLSMRDANVASVEQAERLAMRKLAEGRRAAFRLSYTTHGHSAVSKVGGDRAVWAPDTVVALDDREVGLKGNFYIDTVTFRGSEGGGRTTTLRLLRPADLIFGSDD